MNSYSVLRRRGARLTLVSALGLSSATMGCSSHDSPSAPSTTASRSPTAQEPIYVPRPTVLRDHAQHTMAASERRTRVKRESARSLEAQDDRGYEAVRYDVRGAFDWETKTLHANLDLTVTVADPSAKSIVLDSRVARLLTIASRGTNLPFTEDAAAGLVTIDLSPLPAASSKRDRSLVLSIAYEASTSDGFSLVEPNDGDPVSSRVAYTSSEPTLGSLWLPGNHRPSDRARFSIELEMDRAHDLVANGTRAYDRATAGGKHKVAYRTDFTIPTYLMAFALGDLVHEDDRGGCHTPLSIWHRRGISVDSAKHIAALADMMSTYEELLGPYPFTSYAVVLLPNYNGGMENATITFNLETSGQGTIDFNLNAHELAHQWFGDYVTVKTWGDLWIKEGLATLLSYEAERAQLDHGDRGRLFGEAFSWFTGDAIRDVSLGGGDPTAYYTSGPYQRAAWLLTQIRSLIGDDAFFKALRNVLVTHRFGSVDSDEMIQAFAPYLDGATITKILASLDQPDGPSVAIAASTAAGVDALDWSVSDPTNVLIAPIDITSVNAAGKATVYHLSANSPVTVPLAAGGYIAPDEQDSQPDLQWVYNLDATSYSDLLAPHLVPTSAAALRAFEARSAAHQEAALTSGAFPYTAASFRPGYRALGSAPGQGLAVSAACSTMQSATDATDAAAWSATLLPIVRPTPVFGTYSPYNELASCGVDLPTRAFGKELPRLLADRSDASAARLDYIMSFDFGAKATFDAFAPIARASTDAYLRDRALSRLQRQVAPGSGFSPVDAAEAPRWKALFRDRMATATTGWTLFETFRGARGLNDAVVLPMLAEKLKSVSVPRTSWQVQMVCGGYAIGTANGIAPAAFQAALSPSSAFADSVKAVIDDPSQCP